MKNLLEGKIKVRPEDFVVEEVLNLDVKDEGEYSYYILTKKNMNTFLALHLIEREWKISRDRIGFCGLKDKRAITRQYISIYRGPEKDLKGPGFFLKFIGKGETPLSLGAAKGNLFTITIRNINSKKIVQTLELVGEIGFVNYFGDQRFSCDKHMKEPFVKVFLEKGLEEALKAYFTQHPKKGKLLKKLWEKSPAKFLKKASHLSQMEKIVVKKFFQKRDAHKAFQVFPKTLKLMFLFSYQSYLWNKMASEFIKNLSQTFEVPFVRNQRLHFYTELNDEIRKVVNFELPYVSERFVKELFIENFQEREKDSKSESRIDLDEGKRKLLKKILKKLFDEENFLKAFSKKLAGLKIFTEGQRRLIVIPENLNIIYAKKQEVQVRFFLPSGSYATVFLLKVLSFPSS